MLWVMMVEQQIRDFFLLFPVYDDNDCYSYVVLKIQPIAVFMWNRQKLLQCKLSLNSVLN